MDVKRLAAAARIAIGVGIAAMTGGTAPVNAAPLDPSPPCPTCEPNPAPPPPIPAEKCWKYGRQGPGGPKGGGGVPVYPAQCPPAGPPAN
jgi:hypothetical protein